MSKFRKYAKTQQSCLTCLHLDYFPTIIPISTTWPIPFACLAIPLSIYTLSKSLHSDTTPRPCHLHPYLQQPPSRTTDVSQCRSWPDAWQSPKPKSVATGVSQRLGKLGTWHVLIPLGTLKAREEHVRESWIKAMEARIVRGELQKCYRGEGVNQLQNCKELAERYAGMIRDNKVSLILELGSSSRRNTSECLSRCARQEMGAGCEGGSW